jgi:hypothetical protein
MKFTRTATSRLLRIRVVAAEAVALGGLLSGLLFLIALFSHNHLIFRGAIFALSSSMLGLGVTQFFQAYVLGHAGRWSTLDGQITSRIEQPRKFVTWVVLHSLFAAIYGVVAAFLIWTAIFSVH